MSTVTAAALQNPFPGLRPFREDEEHLFFGRESKVDVMVDKLASTRFLAVVGTSGSGKSSLVNCGLRPALHRGLMARARASWRVAQFRPGLNPIGSLAGVLAAEGVLFSHYAGGLPLEEIIETLLTQSTKGLVETVRMANLPEGTNVLVVADQFEELFRFRKMAAEGSGDASGTSEAAIAFVNLLLEAHADPACPIYVVITMRSDFLGDCSQFDGLPEAINQGQYLVPRLTREERRASVAGPVAVGGAEISPVLLTRLVNDVGDNPDQLSILQHALNRTWTCWEDQGAEGPLELKHYDLIGSMGHALNKHADEAFAALKIEHADPDVAAQRTRRRQKICETIFKALTDLGTDPRGIRRPTKLSTLCELVGGLGEEEEVKAVLEVFREPSRSFIMPPAPEPLKLTSVIDISHESLMRVWERLRLWAEDEAQSARRYRRLAETAVLEAAGKAGLWYDPDLQLALDWQKEQSPTPTWADLYGGGYKVADAFLEKSRLARDTKLATVIFNRRWNMPWRLAIAVLLAGGALWVSELYRESVAEPIKRVLQIKKQNQTGESKDTADEKKPAANERKVLAAAQKVLTADNKLLAAPIAKLDPAAVAAELQKGEERKDRAKRTALDVFLLLCFFAPALGLFFVLDYAGKRILRRIVFPKILEEVAASADKTVREEKLAKLAVVDAADALRTTNASFWRRVGAYLLDLGLFAATAGIMITPIVNTPFLTDFIDHTSYGVSILYTPFLVGWLYEALMLSSARQATLGMKVMGIFVTDQQSVRLSFGGATAWHFAKLLSYLTLGIGFLMQTWTKRHQTLHDLVAKTVVLSRPDQKKVPWWARILCGFIVFLLTLPVVFVAYIIYSLRNFRM